MSYNRQDVYSVARTFGIPPQRHSFFSRDMQQFHSPYNSQGSEYRPRYKRPFNQQFSTGQTEKLQTAFNVKDYVNDAMVRDPWEHLINSMEQSSKVSANTHFLSYPNNGAKILILQRTFWADVMQLNLNGPVNALSVNRDATRVVVAGRNVLKIFAISDDGFVEESNLRFTKTPALNLSCQDVTWNPLDDDVIASASTNGAVVVWNLNKEAKTKSDLTYAAHVRTVNKVAFHPTDPFCMISGSQDATIKLFDLRIAEPISVFVNGTDSIRDAQFSWHTTSIFAAADEAGNVKCWDMRSMDRPVKTFTAHGGPVLSLDFHPTSKSWLATGGRDRVIKVWDWLLEKPSVVYSVQTTASVNKVKWRPSRQHHIASCSMVIDCSVHVWDVQRPYIPFATFDEHKDVATGMAWLNNPHIFLSCGKDGLLIKHYFKDASKPVDTASPVGLSLSSHGNIAWAVSRDLITRQPSRGSVSIKSNVFSDVSKIRTSTSTTSMLRAADLFCPTSKSSLNVVASEGISQALCYEGFVECARNYKFYSKCLVDACEFNSKVAKDARKQEVARAWLLLRDVLEFNSTDDAKHLSCTNANVIPEYTFNITASDPQRLMEVSVLGGLGHASFVGGHHDPTGGSGGGAATETETEDDGQVLYTNASYGALLLDGFADGARAVRTRVGSNNIRNRPYNVHNRGQGAEFFFGDGDLTRIVFADSSNKKESNGAWKLPHEAFEPRRDFGHLADSSASQQIRSGVADVSSGTCLLPTTPQQHFDVLVTQSSNCEEATSENQNLLKLHTSACETVKISQFHCQHAIKDLLFSCVDSGDLQVSVCMLSNLGQLGKKLVDEEKQQCWYKNYIDLLDRFELWAAAGALIKWNPLPSVQSISQQSTLFGLACSSCEKASPKTSWWCQKCRKFTNICSVCKEVVKGLFVCCHCCGHGGHFTHMKKWFDTHEQCPAGCGHRCERNDG